ncbi:hypothetical protein [Jeongeupia chitinilytica]|uniref:Uncharacterized protein n=1 Tax=Jeongeupia chitinilytica TaxID=1041641 RepID=A0ABQ3GXS9_9NEIS|nr:hypothetical protein [Jeongeupia chitinilytica]GHD60310.1 hypothetical protein GCM10007350_13150 [Jeongeupia chitinilytica]
MTWPAAHQSGKSPGKVCNVQSIRTYGHSEQQPPTPRNATIYALMVGDGLVVELMNPILAAGYRISNGIDTRFYVLKHVETARGNDGEHMRAAA